MIDIIKITDRGLIYRIYAKIKHIYNLFFDKNDIITYIRTSKIPKSYKNILSFNVAIKNDIDNIKLQALYKQFLYGLKKDFIVKDIYYICNDCGKKYGKKINDSVCTMHHGKCDICGKETDITNRRNFGYVDQYKLLNNDIIKKVD